MLSDGKGYCIRLQSWASFWRRLFVVWYPRLSSAYAVVALAYQVAFIFNRTRYYTPWLHLLGQEIQRLTPNDAVRTLAAAIAG